MNETYRKVLQIFVMKNYAALVAKLQSRNLPLRLCLEIILQCQHYAATCVTLDVTGIISIWQ